MSEIPATSLDLGSPSSPRPPSLFIIDLPKRLFGLAGVAMLVVFTACLVHLAHPGYVQCYAPELASSDPSVAIET
jgi:hypothetical protein